MHRLSVAIKGKGRAQVDAIIMRSYIAMLEAFQLATPFPFTDGYEFDAAFAVWANRTSVDVELLEKQLLATEIDHMAGMGLSGEYTELQNLILAWAEYLSAYPYFYSRDDLITAKDILDRTKTWCIN